MSGTYVWIETTETYVSEHQGYIFVTSGTYIWNVMQELALGMSAPSKVDVPLLQLTFRFLSSRIAGIRLPTLVATVCE